MVRRTGTGWNTEVYDADSDVEVSSSSDVGLYISKRVLWRDSALTKADRVLLSAGVLPSRDLVTLRQNARGESIPDRMTFDGFVWHSNQCYAKLSAGIRCRRVSRQMGPFCWSHMGSILGLAPRLDTRNAPSVGRSVWDAMTTAEKKAFAARRRRQAVPNGLLATREFQAGEVITVLHGERMSRKEMSRRYDESKPLAIPFYAWRMGNEWHDLVRSNCCPGRLIRDRRLDILARHVLEADVAAVKSGKRRANHEAPAVRVQNCEVRYARLSDGRRVRQVVATAAIKPGAEIVFDRGNKWRATLRAYLHRRDTAMYKRRGRGRPGLTRAGRSTKVRTRRPPREVVARSAGAAQRVRRADRIDATAGSMQPIPRRIDRGASPVAVSSAQKRRRAAVLQADAEEEKRRIDKRRQDDLRRAKIIQKAILGPAALKFAERNVELGEARRKGDLTAAEEEKLKMIAFKTLRTEEEQERIEEMERAKAAAKAKRRAAELPAGLENEPVAPLEWIDPEEHKARREYARQVGQQAVNAQRIALQDAWKLRKDNVRRAWSQGDEPAVSDVQAMQRLQKVVPEWHRLQRVMPTAGVATVTGLVNERLQLEDSAKASSLALRELSFGSAEYKGMLNKLHATQRRLDQLSKQISDMRRG